jgi:ornithine decarboxylase
VSIRERLDELDAAGPRLVLSESQVALAYRRVQRALPMASVHYATKCNPAEPVLRQLHGLGSGFETASAREIDLLTAVGVHPRKIIFSAPVKSPKDIARAHHMGVHRYVVDCAAEVEKVAAAAPGSSVFVRIAVDDEHSQWPLSRKFGAAPSEAPWLFSLASASGLSLEGLAFHVGSQSTHPPAWRHAVTLCGEIAAAAHQDGVRLRSLDVGGGFPVPYSGSAPSIATIAAEISAGLRTWPYDVALVVEPGRYLVAQAGTIQAHVIGLSTREGQHWVFLDVGAFNGLYEASPSGGGLTFRFHAPGLDDEPSQEFEVAGPTCDGDDVIGSGVRLPEGLEIGDIVEIESAGAYSLAYGSEFCGAEPLEVVAQPAEVVIDLRDDEPVIDLRDHDEQLPLARVVEFGDPLFEQAAALELSVFDAAGFVEASGGLDDYRAFDPASSFVVIPDEQGLAGVLRIIWPNEHGFKTTKDFELTADGLHLLASAGPQRICEIGTLAVRPDVRGLGVAISCYNAATRESLLRGCSWFLASIDDGLLEVFRERFYFPFEALAPSDPEYYGSPTTPALLDMLDAHRGTRLNDMDLHRKIFRSPVTEPAPARPLSAGS